jgi:hypothetical protein
MKLFMFHSAELPSVVADGVGCNGPRCYTPQYPSDVLLRRDGHFGPVRYQDWLRDEVPCSSSVACHK